MDEGGGLRALLYGFSVLSIALGVLLFALYPRGESRYLALLGIAIGAAAPLAYFLIERK